MNASTQTRTDARKAAWAETRTTILARANYECETKGCPHEAKRIERCPRRAIGYLVFCLLCFDRRKNGPDSVVARRLAAERAAAKQGGLFR